MTKIEEIDQILIKSFTHFGETKRIELKRLLFEIVKREGVSVENVVAENLNEIQNFQKLKDRLIHRRYPKLASSHKANEFYLGKVDINPEFKADVSSRNIYPEIVYVENEVRDSELLQRMKTIYPQASIKFIDRYGDFIKNKPYSAKTYNERLNEFYIVKEKYDFFKGCPCSPKTVHCGLHIVNMGSGCAFDCTYCYLQAFVNAPGIVFPANIEDFFEEFKQYKKNIRIGSGEYTDSLVFDHITGFSSKIVNFFRDYPDTQFEFKTKSANIENLLKVEGSFNIVISWSMNSPRIADNIEHFTASINERISAAKQCVNHGYSVGFHFDPIFHYEGWESEYKQVIDSIFDNIPGEKIAWMSLGTLRMTKELRKTIENRFPENDILNDEMILGHDQKLRYDHRTRMKIYQNMTNWIRERYFQTKLYLCMEEKSLCNSCQTFPFTKK